MDINQKMLSLKIGSSQIQEKCSKSKVYPWFIIFIKGVDEVSIILYPLPTFIIFLFLLRTRLQNIFTYLL